MIENSYNRYMFIIVLVQNRKREIVNENDFAHWKQIRGGTKYLVDNNDCSFYAPELIFRDTPLMFCMNIPNNAR